nr:MAG TPA: hypothetical protein [Caudoviricetes sp.]
MRTNKSKCFNRAGCSAESNPPFNIVLLLNKEQQYGTELL